MLWGLPTCLHKFTLPYCSRCVTEKRKEKEFCAALREDAAAVLGELAYIDSDCQAAIREAGGIRPLVTKDT